MKWKKQLDKLGEKCSWGWYGDEGTLFQFIKKAIKEARADERRKCEEKFEETLSNFTDR